MSKYSVVQTVRGVRSYADGANEYSIMLANRVASRARKHWLEQGVSAVIEIIELKDNGQHGTTVALFYSMPAQTIWTK